MFSDHPMGGRRPFFPPKVITEHALNLKDKFFKLNHLGPRRGLWDMPYSAKRKFNTARLFVVAEAGTEFRSALVFFHNLA